jgi:hypothetical protein
LIRTRFLGLIALFLAVGACQNKAELPRYAYVVTCDARADRLDTVENRKTGSFDLTAASGGAVPSGAGGFDGCLTSAAQYDGKAKTFSVVAAVQAMNKPDGSKDYRLIAFSLPDVNMVKMGSPVAAPAPGTDPSSLDLSGFGPNHEKAGNQVIERSGNRVLLRIFASDPATLELAVADTKAKTVTTLQGVGPATALGAHLAPGGGAVLVEAAAAAGSATKTGELRLFDAATGHVTGQVSDAHVRDEYFLAIAPTGKVIYHSGEDYAFIDLKQTFGTDLVIHVLDTNYPSVFFANL